MEDKFFLIAFISIVLVVAAIAAYYAIVNLKSGGTFFGRLDNHAIGCNCPVPACGESFRLPIKDITILEKEDWGDGSYRWYIYDRTGRRFWLTSNYDNPADVFIAEIRKRIPEVTETTL